MIFRLVVLALTTPTLLSAHRAYADTIVVGSDLSNYAESGTSFCPSSSNCSLLAQQFTLLSAAVITDIKIVVSGPIKSSPTDGTFTMGIGVDPLDNTGVATGNFVYQISPVDPNQGDYTTEILDFANLNISLSAGTYYLGLAGASGTGGHLANFAWNYAPALSTPTGVMGSGMYCDFNPAAPGACSIPTVWTKSIPGPFAMQMSTTAITPEPSTFILLVSGLAGISGIARKRLAK
ncbi:PEP-CTERM sorting domain-containing protein [Granulicella sp. dw_53]|uniref:PEP-CTERM sorting domain-containing protein n=1 Tax=Granulicella sp. dw_53 TaxID=2719792 RepID=UPI0031F6E0F6